jgi:hypothetical protein
MNYGNSMQWNWVTAGLELWLIGMLKKNPKDVLCKKSRHETMFSTQSSLYISVDGI